VLARSLGAALEPSVPTAPRIVEEAIKAGPTAAQQVKSLVSALLAEIERPLGQWVVIDDYHAIEPGSAADSLVERLEASGLFRLIVASRTRPGWATSRRRLYGDLAEIGRDELALDDSEAAALLAGRGEVAALGRRARGWPALVALAAVARAEATGEAPVGAGSEQLYDFFAEEVFRHAPARAQDALLRLALLPVLAREELGRVLGRAAVTAALRTGLVSEVAGRIEIHPLLREFLYEKIARRADLRPAVEDGIGFALAGGHWDEAFELIVRFSRSERLEELITKAFLPLVESGRVSTLESFGVCAAGVGGVPQAVLDLIDAEVAFRDGVLERAVTLGKEAARRLEDKHPLKARSYIVAGTAANLDWKLDEAFDLLTTAMNHCHRQRDLSDASWRRCLTSLFLEGDRLRDAAEEFLLGAGAGAPLEDDRIRVIMIRLHVGRLLTGFWDLRRETKVGDMLLPAISDPLTRSSWGNTYGYSLMLQARYELAKDVLTAALSDIERYQLEFARPHIEWSLAAVELGLRRFSRCESWLRKVEAKARDASNSYLPLNCRALRARLLLAQRQPDDAIAITNPTFDEFPRNAMHGEYLATRAVALAAAGLTEQALTLAEEATSFTRAVEARVLGAGARAIAKLGTPEAKDAAVGMLRTASELGTWDGAVCAMRAAPEVLAQLVDVGEHRHELAEALDRSRDSSLLRAAGFEVRREYGREPVLSRREKEVIDLLSQGLKTREIAKTLFISQATVKVHVRHILEKLNARTRAEAVARYADASAGLDELT
jgi:ATP/maltotriose-dependent transcriptional regulator MalT